MSTTLSYGLSATGAVVQLGLICVVGFAFGRYPRPDGLLTQPALAEISSQIFWLYTPCLLIATFGANLTVDVLIDSLGLLFWSCIMMGVNLAVAVAVARCITVERGFRASFLLAATFNNGGSVPMLLMAGITATAPQFADDPTAYSRAVVAIWCARGRRRRVVAVVEVAERATLQCEQAQPVWVAVVLSAALLRAPSFDVMCRA